MNVSGKAGRTMAKKNDEILKYITEQVVTYLDTPSEVRKQQRLHREHWTVRWFGLLPLSMSMLFKRKQRAESELQAGADRINERLGEHIGQS